MPASYPLVLMMSIDNPTINDSLLWRIGSAHTPYSSPFKSEVSKWYQLNKQIIDVFLALVLLVLALPIIVIAGLIIKITSRGPIFFWQTRMGRFGKPYTIFKLRTMTHRCESISGPQWSTPGDTRITPIGRILRKTHIDELPQLLNVIRGEMSLVGPRPERPEFLPKLEDQIPYYTQRLLVKPGITGLAQVQLPPDTDLESVRLKLAYDLYYVSRFNFWLDIRLMICTGVQFFGIPTSLSKCLLRIPGGEKVEKPYSEATSKEEMRTSELQPA